MARAVWFAHEASFWCFYIFIIALPHTQVGFCEGNSTYRFCRSNRRRINDRPAETDIFCACACDRESSTNVRLFGSGGGLYSEEMARLTERSEISPQNGSVLPSSVTRLLRRGAGRVEESATAGMDVRPTRISGSHLSVALHCANRGRSQK